ncbi:MAG: methyltransferase [Pseudomonadota bacterium]
MSPIAQLLERHRARFEQAPPALWVNPPADLSPSLVHDESTVFVQDWALQCALESNGLASVFASTLPPLAGEGPVFFSIPREKARLRMMAEALAAAMAASETNRPLLAAGEARAGGRSAARHLETAFEQVRKIDSARHCVLYEASQPHNSGACDLASWMSAWPLQTPAGTLKIHSLPGVFAHGSLDEGTQLLLEHLPGLLTQRPRQVLDLGCGTGVIGAAALRLQPELDLTLADSSALALEASRATLNANALTARCVPSDGLSAFQGHEGARHRFDLVLSNPPFHEGHHERDDRGAGVFEGIERVLAPGGRLVLVVNTHLPWPRWLDQQFGGHEVLAHNRRFQLLSAS